MNNEDLIYEPIRRSTEESGEKKYIVILIAFGLYMRSKDYPDVYTKAEADAILNGPGGTMYRAEEAE